MKQESKRKQAEAVVLQHKPTITKTASKLNRDGVHVEDLLLKRNEEYQAHIEDLRRIKEKEEMQSLQEPHINKVSQNMVRQEPAYTRLYDIRKQTLAKREVLRSKLREKELKEYRNTPQINQVSKRMSRGVDAILEWEKERKEKVEKRNQEIEKQELAKCKPKRINPTSDRIAKKMNRGSRVEDHLLADHERKKMEREEKLRREYQQQLEEAVPMISVHSASLTRNHEEKIFDRLYKTASQKAEKQMLQLQIVDETKDPKTGQILYKPTINDRSASIKRATPVEDILQAKGEERKRKRELLAKQLEQELNERKSVVGPYSQLLVNILEKRTNQTTQERLHQPIKQKIKDITKRELYSQEQVHTFQPEINPLSRVIDENNNKGKKDRTELLYKKAKDYESKKDRLRQQIEAEKLSECTFSPRASSPGLRRTSIANGSNVTRNSLLSIAERNAEWVRQKSKRLQEEREEKQKLLMEECTFQPNVGKNRTPSSGRASLNDSRSFTPPPKRPASAQKQRDSYSSRSQTPPPRTLLQNEPKIAKFYQNGVSNDNQNIDNWRNYIDEEIRSAPPNPHIQPLGLREPSEPVDPMYVRQATIPNDRILYPYDTVDFDDEPESDEKTSVRREQERNRQNLNQQDLRSNHNNNYEYGNGDYINGDRHSDSFEDITIDTEKFSPEANAILRNLLLDFAASK